jgi:hypothetical protein
MKNYFIAFMFYFLGWVVGQALLFDVPLIGACVGGLIFGALATFVSSKMNIGWDGVWHDIRRKK